MMQVHHPVHDLFIQYCRVLYPTSQQQREIHTGDQITFMIITKGTEEEPQGVPKEGLAFAPLSLLCSFPSFP